MLKKNIPNYYLKKKKHEEVWIKQFLLKSTILST